MRVRDPPPMSTSVTPPVQGLTASVAARERADPDFGLGNSDRTIRTSTSIHHDQNRRPQSKTCKRRSGRPEKAVLQEAIFEDGVGLNWRG